MSAEHDPPGPSETRDLDQAEHPPPPAASSEPPGATPSVGDEAAVPAVVAPSGADEAAVPAGASPSVGGGVSEATASEPGPDQAAAPSAVEADPASSGSSESAFDRRVDLEALETLEGDLALIEAGMSHLEADDLDAAEAAVEQLRSGEAPPTS